MINEFKGTYERKNFTDILTNHGIVRGSVTLLDGEALELNIETNNADMRISIENGIVRGEIKVYGTTENIHVPTDVHPSEIFNKIEHFANDFSRLIYEAMGFDDEILYRDAIEALPNDLFNN